MQVSVETLEGLDRKITVTLPADRVGGAVKERLKKLTKTVKINGFRPGKVPFAVVEKRYGESVRSEVIDESIRETLGPALNQESVQAAGRPAIESIEDHEKDGLKYVAAFEVYPEFEIAGTENIEVNRPVAEVTQADIDEMIDSLRKQRVNWNKVERACQADDQVVIDFTGFLEGEEFQGGKAEKTPLVLGSGSMIPGFEDQIIGMSAGEERSINVDFPEKYHSEELAGKAVEFKIAVHDVNEPVLPELDEEFVKTLGIPSGSKEDFLADVEKNMKRELKANIERQIKEQVMKGLGEQNEISLPKSLIGEEIHRLKHQFAEQYGQQGHKIDPHTLEDQMFAEEAKTRVQLGLIIAELVKSHELKASEERVDEQLQEMAASYERPEEVIQYYKQKPELLQNIEGLVLEQEVVDWVLQRAKVTDESKAFKDIMQPQQPA